MSGSQPRQNRTSKVPGQAGQVWKPRNDMRAAKFGTDPYQDDRRTPSEPTVCPDCGAVYQAGRWAWVSPAPEGANQEPCPACQRVRDRFPAGTITLEGGFLAEHRDEIFGLVQNQAEAERQEHPLNRIMEIDEAGPEAVTITTTDIHLPRRILEALHRAYEGDMEFTYGDDETSLRGRWAR